MALGPGGPAKSGPATRGHACRPKKGLAGEKGMPAAVAARQTAQPQPGAPSLIAATPQPGPAGPGSKGCVLLPGAIRCRPAGALCVVAAAGPKSGGVPAPAAQAPGGQGPRWRARAGRANLDRWGHKPPSQSRPAERWGPGAVPPPGPAFSWWLLPSAGTGRKRPGPAFLRAPGRKNARPGAQGYGGCGWARCYCGLPRGAIVPAGPS